MDCWIDLHAFIINIGFVSEIWCKIMLCIKWWRYLSVKETSIIIWPKALKRIRKIDNEFPSAFVWSASPTHPSPLPPLFYSSIHSFPSPIWTRQDNESYSIHPVLNIVYLCACFSLQIQTSLPLYILPISLCLHRYVKF